MEQPPGATFEAVYECGVTGLVPGMEVAINDNVGTTVFGPTASGITEVIISGVGTGVYTCATLVAPNTEGQYSIIWSNDGTFLPNHGIGEEDLVVEETGAADIPILDPDATGLFAGPCSAWVSSDDILACCEQAQVEVGTMTSLLDGARNTASQVLFELSGRQFSGLCLKTSYRPCRSAWTCGCGFDQILSRGHVISWNWGTGYWSCNGDQCGCTPASEVKLSGYPVRAVTKVKIGGVVVDPNAYRLDGHRWLVRIDGSRWPSCAITGLPDTEAGTFSVNYLYGQSPPLAGVDAAKQLACEIFKACNPGTSGECALPTGVTRVTRSGVTFERSYFSRDARTGAWRTGLALVDQFLNSYNPYGLPRRPTFYSASPARSRYGRVAG